MPPKAGRVGLEGLFVGRKQVPSKATRTGWRGDDEAAGAAKDLRIPSRVGVGDVV